MDYKGSTHHRGLKKQTKRQDDSLVAARPSSTEPKYIFYYCALDETEKGAENEPDIFNRCFE